MVLIISKQTFFSYFPVTEQSLFTHQVGSAKEKLHSSLCCRAGHWRTRFIQHHQYKHVQGLTVKWNVILFGHRTNEVSNAVLLRKKYIYRFVRSNNRGAFLWGDADQDQ